MQSCWKAKQRHQALIWAGDLYFIAQSPLKWFWRHRESRTSLNKTLLTHEDCLHSTELPCLSQTLMRWMRMRGCKDRDEDEEERVQLESPASWFLEKRSAQGQAESLCRELLRFIAAWKGNLLKLALFVASEPQWPSEKERASQALGPGTSDAHSTRVFLLAAMKPTWGPGRKIMGKA